MWRERVAYPLLDIALTRGLLPDPLLRLGSFVGAELRERRELRGGVAGQEERLQQLLDRMRGGPIAEATDTANEQHYELPADFFGLFLGPRRKYSGCLWPAGVDTLEQAEQAMLELTCERAQIGDGMRLLDLGCGWGSLSIWLAEHYPACEVLAVSNSDSQRRFIESRARDLQLRNLRVVTADVNGFVPTGTFDRVLSIEMFEHMRNWHELLRRVAGWLKPDGRFFMHVFSHRTVPYLFEGTWAAERFFTAGLMPSHELPLHFQRHLTLEERWAVPGTHYASTLRAWLERLDDNREQALAVLAADGRSTRDAQRLLATWRLFLISTAVIWGRDAGNRWLVSHYRFRPALGAS